MKLETVTVRDVPIVRVEGEVDMSNTHAIDVAVDEAVTNQAHALVVDLSGVTYLDSAGVRLLYQLDARLAVHQQHLVLVIPPGATILRTLQAAGVIGSLVLASTEEVALLIALAPQDSANGPNGTTG